MAKQATKLTLFNHKGGVGKTTLTVNLAHALSNQGERVLIVDCDPQCNISAFYLKENDLDDALGLSEESDSTIWSAVKPVVESKGPPRKPLVYKVPNNVRLILGDVMLANYEEELSSAWTDSFARKPRGYAVSSAMRDAVAHAIEATKATFVLFDVGPNVGALNRIVVLDSDYLITPVAPDLFSLRALTTVGRAISQWVTDWKTIRSLAPKAEQDQLIAGSPKFLGYIVSAFKSRVGEEMSEIHKRWQAELAPRVKRRIVDELRAVDPALLASNPVKLGDVRNFQGLAANAQEAGLPIAELRNHVNAGYGSTIADARLIFDQLATRIREAIANNA